MSLHFEKYAVKGNEFVRLVASELGESQDNAGKIISAVFHALRNRLSHEASFHLFAQLPMPLKGVYVDGWRFNKDFNQINLLSDFLDEVNKEDNGKSGYDFSDRSKAGQAVVQVFKALNYIVSAEEMDNMLEVIPLPLQSFIKESMYGKNIIL